MTLLCGFILHVPFALISFLLDTRTNYNYKIHIEHSNLTLYVTKSSISSVRNKRTILSKSRSLR